MNLSEEPTASETRAAAACVREFLLPPSASRRIAEIVHREAGLADVHRELCRATDLVAVLWAHIPDADRKRVQQDIVNRRLADWDAKAGDAIAKVG